MTEYTITRQHLAEALHSQMGIPVAEGSDLVDAVLEEVLQGLEQNGMAKIAGFGTFEVREKKPRVGRNPKTKEEVIIDARRVLSFRPSASLRKEVSENE